LKQENKQKQADEHRFILTTGGQKLLTKSGAERGTATFVYPCKQKQILPKQRQS